VIVSNGVVRTMDPSLPTTAALAIAGDRIVGGVGTHEHALPTPERVDLRGRCVLPAFTDAHVHFPTWSLAQHDVVLEGTSSLAEAVARVEAAAGGHAATLVLDPPLPDLVGMPDGAGVTGSWRLGIDRAPSIVSGSWSARVFSRHGASRGRYI